MCDFYIIEECKNFEIPTIYHIFAMRNGIEPFPPWC